MVLHCAVVLLLLLQLSSGHAGREGAQRQSDDSTLSRRSAVQKKKKLVLWWSRKKERKLARQAYRMAILSSLAYHDFRDGKDLLMEDGNWAFSLEDDPSPTQYLLRSDKRRRRGYNNTVMMGKKRHPIQRVLLGASARFRVSLCQTRYNIVRIKAAIWRKKSSHETQQCKQKVLQKHEAGKRYNVEWAFNNWHEESKAKVRWHDTDLIIARSGTSEIVLAFAGTASPQDAVTNIQTLEPVSHSGLFKQLAAENSTNTTLEGSIHRGFLNAYARVVRGTIQRLNKDNLGSPLTKSLDDYFRRCIVQQSAPRKNSTAVAILKPKPSRNELSKRKRRKDARRRHICHSNGNRLIDILRDVTTTSLESGHTVHLVGHSLAGALATIHALDIVMNYAHIPIKNLHLWTFGAPEVADSHFWESAGSQSSRLRNFFSDDARYHRYVTQSEKNCATDIVASITSKSLNRRAIRRLGGVRGDVIHTIEPSFLLCNVTAGSLHDLKTYLSGISSQISGDNKLNTDFPAHLRNWLGET